MGYQPLPESAMREFASVLSLCGGAAVCCLAGAAVCSMLPCVLCNYAGHSVRASIACLWASVAVYLAPHANFLLHTSSAWWDPV